MMAEVFEEDDDEPQGELLPETSVLRGRYGIRRCIAQGGMATVYAATREDGFEVALKVLHAEYVKDPEVLERFENEMRVGRALQDVPAIVRPLDFGFIPELGGRPFMALELQTAPTLGDLLLGTKMVPLRACRVARAIADALCELHARGVIHRDIKPDNILVDESTEPLRIRILDLGFAHSMGNGVVPKTAGLTKSGERVGTKLYMPPEQATGVVETTPRVDVYALGATLWEMLEGIPPYYGIEIYEVLRRKCNFKMPAPSLRLEMPKLAPELAGLVDEAMERDPELRLPSASAFRERLDAILRKLEGAEGTESARTIEFARALTVPTAVSDAEGTSTSTPVVELATNELVEEDMLEAAAALRGHTERARAAEVEEQPARIGGPEVARSRELVEPPVPQVVDPPKRNLSTRSPRRVVASGVVLLGGAIMLLVTLLGPDKHEAEAPERAPTEVVSAATSASEPPHVNDVAVAAPPVPPPTATRSNPVERTTIDPTAHDAARPSVHPVAATPDERHVKTAAVGRNPTRSSTNTSKVERARNPDRSTTIDPGVSEVDCGDVRTRADAAYISEDWKAVLELTKSTKCWPDDSARVRMRVSALLESGDLEACARLAQSTDDSKTKRLAALCLRKAAPTHASE